MKAFSSAKSPSEGAPASLWEWLISIGKQRRSSLALAAVHQDPTPGEDQTSHLQWTYDSFLNKVEVLASFLVNKGIQPGETITTFVTNSAEWALLLWTSIRLGTVFAPLDPSSLKRTEELKSLWKELQPSIVLVQDPEAIEEFQRTGLPFEIGLYAEKQGHPADPWFSILEQALTHKDLPPAPHHHLTDPTETALIMFTSGSTNLPKGCLVTAGSLMAQIDGYYHFHRSNWDESTRFIVTSNCFRPICYLGCFNSWVRGGAVIFSGFSFDETAALKTITTLQGTHMLLVPTQAKALANAPARETYQPTTLKFVGISADMIDRSLLETFRAALEPAQLLPYWGMSEGAPLMGWEGDEPLKFWTNGIAGLGRALPGTAVKICDDRTSEILKRSETGELHVCSTSVIKGYLGGRSPESFYEDSDGAWLRTGDLAVMDEEGAIYVVGRIKDIIKCKGFGIVPAIVRDFLFRHLHIECTVIGIPNTKYGNVPIAICGKDDHRADVDEVVNKMQDALGKEYTLGGFYLLRELGLETWPLDSSGKVRKGVLREAVEKVMGR